MGTRSSYLPERLAVVLAAAMVATPVLAAKGSAVATVTTVKSLSITKTRDLDFGAIVATPGGGTVTLDPYTGARTTAGVVARGTASSTARFTGAGTPGRIVGVSYPATALTLKQVSGAATMTLEELTINSVQYAFAGYDPRLIPDSGILEVLIGGRLRVGPNQAAGDYATTFNVTIDYY